MKKRLIPVIRDEEFIRGKIPMTKEAVRHYSVLRLGLREGDIVFDIGSGTGSVACEIASLSDSIGVYAFEKNAEAFELTKKNVIKFGLSNIHVINGAAPGAFSGLPAPDAAFVGGSSGELRKIMQALSTAPKEIRVVINAVSLETQAEIQSLVKECKTRDLIVEQVAVSRAREIGGYHLMTAENPVMVASFTLMPGRNGR